MPRRTILLALTALAAVAGPAAAAGAAPALDLAETLAQQWGRCPTARPAHAVLAAAHRPAPPALRAARARAALRAWTRVADDCRRPVPTPVVIR